MMTDQELLTIVESEEKRALGYGDGELSHEREKALKYYNGDLYGNEQDGRSQVVTTEVADTVEWILPTLLDIFTASDKAVEFQPETPKDEESCKQATDTCNYVFYKQNNGFIALYSFFKDALIQKNGYLKVYYEKQERERKESYRGLTQGQLTMLMGQPGVELLAATSYPDPTAPQPAQMPAAVGQAMNAPIEQPQLYDVQIKVFQEYGKVCIKPVPPEEMLISVDVSCVDLQEAPFVAHRCQKTISELKEMGYDIEGIEDGDDNQMKSSGEWLERQQFDEESLYKQTDSTVIDDSMRKVWVTEAYILVDFNGDGEAELRKVVKAGRKVLENEEADVIPFAAITPIIMTHRHFGKSVADTIMDLQLIKSTLMRQVLDNIYLTNAPRNAVLASREGVPQANLDDLLTVRPGGIVREYVPNAVRPLEVPFMGQYGLQVMEYVDTVAAKRTGVTENLAGMDSDALNKTARGATIIQNNAMMRIKLIARVFAETGVKSLFKLILHCLSTYQDKAMVIRLTDKFVEVDPREWDTGWDMTVNVGLGTGNKDQQLVHLQTIAQAQAAYLQAGVPVVNPKNIYNAQKRIVENAGFKSVEEFWSDPEQAPQQPPQPDPRMVQMQQEQQMKAQQAQMDMQLEQSRLQQQAQAEERRAQLEIAKAESQMRLEREKADQEFAIEQARMALEAEKAKAQIMLEQLKAKANITLQREKARGDLQLRAGIADVQARQAQMQQEKDAEEPDDSEDKLATVLESVTKSFEGIASALTRPRRIVRGPDGKAEGVE